MQGETGGRGGEEAGFWAPSRLAGRPPNVLLDSASQVCCLEGPFSVASYRMEQLKARQAWSSHQVVLSVCCGISSP